MKEKLELSQQTSQDNITLTVENQRLSKALSTSQKAVSRVAELESELEDKVCVASGVVGQNYLHSILCLVPLCVCALNMLMHV